MTKARFKIRSTEIKSISLTLYWFLLYYHLLSVDRLAATYRHTQQEKTVFRRYSTVHNSIIYDEHRITQLPFKAFSLHLCVNVLLRSISCTLLKSLRKPEALTCACLKEESVRVGCCCSDTRRVRVEWSQRTERASVRRPLFTRAHETNGTLTALTSSYKCEQKVLTLSRTSKWRAGSQKGQKRSISSHQLWPGF